MQVFIDSIKAKQLRGEDLTIVEYELLYLRDKGIALENKLDEILQNQKEIMETFQQGSGAIKFFKIAGLIVAPIIGIYSLWQMISKGGS